MLNLSNYLNFLTMFCIVFCSYEQQIQEISMNPLLFQDEMTFQSHHGYNLVHYDPNLVWQPLDKVNTTPSQEFRSHAYVNHQLILPVNLPLGQNHNTRDAFINKNEVGETQPYFLASDVPNLPRQQTIVINQHGNHFSCFYSYSPTFQLNGHEQSLMPYYNRGPIPNTVTQQIIPTGLQNNHQESNTCERNTENRILFDATRSISRASISFKDSIPRNTSQISSVETFQTNQNCESNFNIFPSEFLKKYERRFRFCLKDLGSTRAAAQYNPRTIFATELSSKPLQLTQEKDHFIGKLLNFLEFEQTTSGVENEFMSREEIVNLIYEEFKCDTFKAGSFFLYVCFNTRGFRNLRDRVDNEIPMTLLHAFRGNHLFSLKCLLDSIKEWDLLTFEPTTFKEGYDDMITIGRVFLHIEHNPKDVRFTWKYKCYITNGLKRLFCQ